jgi:outer membrane protein assembly factor BamB
MLYRNSLVSFFFIVSVAVFPCLAAEGPIAPLVAKELLQDAGLGQVWQTKLAVKKEGERLVILTLLGDKVYALTSTNYLFCLNKDTGNLAFGLQVAPNGFPVLEPQRYENNFLVVAGNQLVQIDATLGTITRTEKFDYTVTSPIVRNALYFYATGMDSRIHAIGIAANAFLFEAAATNGSMPTTVLATKKNFVFATDKGNVVCISATGPSQVWQFDATDKITAQLVKDNNDLYVASWDTRIYKLDASSGKQVWNCQLGGMLKQSPQVTHDAVYQFAAGEGVTAIDKVNGKPLWTVEDGIDLLAQINGKAFLMTNNHTAAAVDSATHKRLYTINFAQVVLHASNTVDGKIYVADHAGRVACIAAAK